MKKKITALLLCLMMAAVSFAGCAEDEGGEAPQDEGTKAVYEEEEASEDSISLDEIPEFSGEPYVAVNGNVPDFTQDEMTESSFEDYESLDSMGRCGTAYACIGRDIMPTEDRGSIGQVKPSGWHTVRYDNVDGKYLYNRCHLIGYQLTGENANERNLITGTRYMNVDGMLPFEDMVADYVKETGNHVLYRVTPVFRGDDLVASGVHMEAMSVEDEGDGISYNVYVYDNQPGIIIDYATGESRSSGQEAEEPSGSEKGRYIINTNTGKFHKPDCRSVSTMNEENKEVFRGSRDELISQGYEPCGNCHP